MKKFLAALLLLVPVSAGAVELPATTTGTSSENAYILQPRVTISSPTTADLIAAAGTVTVAAPVDGDILAAGGTVVVTEGAKNDVRVAGGKVSVSGAVGGDVAAAGGTVRVHASARNIYVAGGSVDVEGGSTGTVTIYGVNVFLSGDYQGNVSIVASNRLTIGEGTHIKGLLRYSAPEELVVPAGAAIEGGTRYTGAYAYVPTSEQAHQYAVIGTILFLAVRVLAGCILAGLITGLFLSFADRVSSAVLSRRPYAFLKLFGIGLALAVLTPISCILLLVSFVGAELALLFIILFALLVLIAYTFSGIVIGALLRKTVLHKIHGEFRLSWQDAVLGTVIAHIIGLIPFIGTVLIGILVLACAGALSRYAYYSILTIEE